MLKGCLHFVAILNSNADIKVTNCTGTSTKENIESFRCHLYKRKCCDALAELVFGWDLKLKDVGALVDAQKISTGCSTEKVRLGGVLVIHHLKQAENVAMFY